MQVQVCEVCYLQVCEVCYLPTAVCPALALNPQHPHEAPAQWHPDARGWVATLVIFFEQLASQLRRGCEHEEVQ